MGGQTWITDGALGHDTGKTQGGRMKKQNPERYIPENHDDLCTYRKVIDCEPKDVDLIPYETLKFFCSCDVMKKQGKE